MAKKTAVQKRREAEKAAVEEESEEEEVEESEEGEDDEEGSSEGVEEGEVEDDESSGEEGDDDAGDESEGDEEEEDSDDDDEFEDQGSSSDEDERFEAQAADESDDEEDDDEESGSGGGGGSKVVAALEDKGPRHWSIKSKEVTVSREHELAAKRLDGRLEVEEALHVDDLSSDDEEVGNTVGRVPLRWYENLEHMGYGLDGQRILKKEGPDGLDRAIASRDDPNFKRTVYDALNDREVVLSDRDLEVIRRLQAGAYAHPEHDAHPEYIPYFSEVDKHVMPLSERDPMKRRFVPSKWELMKVTKIMQGLKDGSIKPLAEQRRLKQEAKDVKNAPSLIWSPLDDDLDGLETRKGPMHIAAPKLPLPGHAASYRPPEEYLLSPEEEEQWRKTDPEDRELDFLPKQYDNLRSVGAYPELVKDRFERCLDLYLCPRSFKRRLQIDPESLVPKLPSPKDLRPFPTAACIRFGEKEAHGGYNGGVAVRCLAPSLDGQWLASGDDNGVLRLWEVATARCVKAWRLGPNGISSEEEEQTKSSFSSSSSSSEAPSPPITLVCWNPNPLHHVLAVAAGNAVVLVATGTGGAEACEVTDALLHSCESEPSGPPFAAAGATDGKGGRALSSVTWAPADDAAPLAEGEGKKGKKKGKRSKEDEEEVAAAASGQSARRVGARCVIRFPAAVTCLCWHRKGDYLATAVPGADTGNVMVHQVSKRVTQVVVRKQMKTVCALAFHPHQPVFFVATQQHVRVYHLVEQKLLKKLLTGCKHISSMDIHPSGDHVLIGSYDRRCVWFDLDRGVMPYKTLKYHTKALRGVGFHKAFPLMATASDDNSVHVFHATVYSDLMKDPLIVPVKVLKGEHVKRRDEAAPADGESGSEDDGESNATKKATKVGVLAMAFHPTQPWLFSAGADGTIVLYQDL